ncbi:hypothetical protein PSBY109024_18860 [Pseudoalteromonas byunsanensis]
MPFSNSIFTSAQTTSHTGDSELSGICCYQEHAI